MFSIEVNSNLVCNQKFAYKTAKNRPAERCVGSQRFISWCVSWKKLNTKVKEKRDSVTAATEDIVRKAL